MKTLKSQILDDLRDLELREGLVKLSDKSQIEEAHRSWAQNAVLVIAADNGSPLFDFFDAKLDGERDRVLARHGCYLEWINHAVAAIYKHDTADIYGASDDVYRVTI